MTAPLESSPASAAAGANAVLKKAMKGALALGLRQLLVQTVTFAGGIALTRLLTPSEFGIFGIFGFVLGFLSTLSDVGLGASLIREKAEPEERDYRVIFTAQQALVTVVLVVFWIAAPSVAAAYHLPPGDRWLFRMVGLSLFVGSFQTIPAIRLERHLAFDRLAIAEVAQTLVYNAVAVALAWMGYGATAVAIAVLARALVGALIIQLVSRWRFAWAWDWPRLKSHLAFGLPYQGISFVSLVKDSITPVLVGLLVSTAAVGFINWAQMVAAYAVMALMIFQRIYLPMFARLQADLDALGSAVERVVWATNAISAPLSILTFVLFEPLTTIVFGTQWLEARPIFQLLWLANVFVPTATPLLGLLNALGHSRVALGFALTWMLGTWAIGAPLIARYGAIGFAIANFVVQFSNVALCYVAKAKVRFSVLPTIAPAWTAAALVGLATYGLARVVVIEHLAMLVSVILSALSAYVGVIWLFDRAAIAKIRALFS